MASIKFYRKMSTSELMEWLKLEGLGKKDLDTMEEESFTGESFLLSNEELLKEIGVKAAGRVLLMKLVASASEQSQDSQPKSTIESGIPTLNTQEQSKSDTQSGSIAQQEMVGRNNLSDVPEDSQLSHFRKKNFGKSHSIACDDSKRGGASERREVYRRHSSSTTVSSQSSSITEDDVPLYCTTGVLPLPSGYRPHLLTKVWEEREVLRVHFEGSSMLGAWGLTESDILQWAAVWEASDNDNVPVFEKGTLEENSDIRVRFSDSEGCWSMVGNEAERIPSMPSMVLNLRGLTRQLQKSLVIHLFGHALGMEHEHLRSDFLTTVGKFIDQSKIPKGEVGRVFGQLHQPACSYDVDSIMHYWFNPAWLREPGLAVTDTIASDNRLTIREKTYLLGMGTRQGAETLPKKPSPVDFEHLIDIYENPRHTLSSPFPLANVSMLSSTSECKPPPFTEPLPRTAGQPQTNVLNDHHVKVLRQTLWDARAKWRDLGRNLKFSEGHLDTFQRVDVGESLVAVLVAWLQTGQATSGELVVALVQPNVGRGDLAERLTHQLYTH